jgi:hypothetical protein
MTRGWLPELLLTLALFTDPKAELVSVLLGCDW